MKRRRTGDTLTGGTKDFNPQYFSTSIGQSAADTTTTVGVSTPPGIGLNMSGRPLAMEILKAFIYWDTSQHTYANVPGAGSQTEFSRTLYISSKNFGSSAPSLGAGDATVFVASEEKETYVTATAASETAVVRSYPIIIDLTDGNGHGILYANQTMYFQVSSIGAGGNIQTARVKLLFREKYITEEELLGLVLQSNQN